MRSRAAGRPCHSRRVAAAVELAVLLPFIVFGFLIVADFGRVFYYAQTIENCARCAALYASRSIELPPGGSPSDLARQAALAEGATLQPLLKPEDVTVNVGAGNATVTVRYTFRTLTAFPGIPSTVPLASTVQMRVPAGAAAP